MGKVGSKLSCGLFDWKVCCCEGKSDGKRHRVLNSHQIFKPSDQDTSDDDDDNLHSMGKVGSKLSCGLFDWKVCCCEGKSDGKRHRVLNSHQIFKPSDQDTSDDDDDNLHCCEEDPSSNILQSERTVEFKVREGDVESYETLKHLTDETYKSVGLIMGYLSYGTGFRVGEKYIMTSLHLVKEICGFGGIFKESNLKSPDVYICFDYSIEYQEDPLIFHFTAQIKYANEDFDVAILELQESESKKLPPKILCCIDFDYEMIFDLLGQSYTCPNRAVRKNVTIWQKGLDVVYKAQNWSIEVFGENGYRDLEDPNFELCYCFYQYGMDGTPGIITLQKDTSMTNENRKEIINLDMAQTVTESTTNILPFVGTGRFDNEPYSLTNTGSSWYDSDSDNEMTYVKMVAQNEGFSNKSINAPNVMPDSISVALQYHDSDFEDEYHPFIHSEMSIPYADGYKECQVVTDFNFNGESVSQLEYYKNHSDTLSVDTLQSVSDMTDKEIENHKAFLNNIDSDTVENDYYIEGLRFVDGTYSCENGTECYRGVEVFPVICTDNDCPYTVQYSGLLCGKDGQDDTQFEQKTRSSCEYNNKHGAIHETEYEPDIKFPLTGEENMKINGLAEIDIHDKLNEDVFRTCEIGRYDSSNNDAKSCEIKMVNVSIEREVEMENSNGSGQCVGLIDLRKSSNRNDLKTSEISFYSQSQGSVCEGKNDNHQPCECDQFSERSHVSLNSIERDENLVPLLNDAKDGRCSLEKVHSEDEYICRCIKDAGNQLKEENISLEKTHSESNKDVLTFEPVVVFMLLRGYPTFYYKGEKSNAMEEIVGDDKLVNAGITMRTIYNDMKKYHIYRDLCADIFMSKDLKFQHAKRRVVYE